MATHSSILAWETPWIEEPGGLQSMGLQKSWTRLSDYTAMVAAETPLPRKVFCIVCFVWRSRLKLGKTEQRMLESSD